MRVLALLAFAMLGWGNLASANLPSDAGGDALHEVQVVQSWMAYLNANYQNVDVSLLQDVHQPGVTSQAKAELQALENVLRNEVSLPAKSLKLLACVRPVCGGPAEGGKGH